MPENKGSHLDLDDRFTIQESLTEGESFREIARILGISPSTVSHEVKTNRVFHRSSATFGLSPTRCAHYKECKVTSLCYECKSHAAACKRCKVKPCFDLCHNFERYVCPKLDRAPFVCTPCSKKHGCSFDKATYKASKAQAMYEKRLRESRLGIDCSRADLERMVFTVKKLLGQGQSLEAIWATHADEFPVGVRTFYNYIERGVMGMANLELPRKVKYKIRKKKEDETKTPKLNFAGRTYADWKDLSFDECVDTVQMDVVEGRRQDTKCILSLFFVRFKFQLYVLLERHDQACVLAAFNALDIYCEGRFRDVFSIILTDRGSEFLDYESLEQSTDGSKRCRIYYCDPVKPGQKGACEKNHVELRKILPKGISDFDALTFSDISLATSHVNSYPRESLGGITPWTLASQALPKSLLENLGVTYIPPDNVTMSPSLLK